MLDNANISLYEFIDIAKRNDAEIIQYRSKYATLEDIKKRLIEIRKIFDGFLIVNDRYELVEFCDGVHIGQEDLALIDGDLSKAMKILREVVGRDKIIGLTTHNEEEVVRANDFDLNYIGLGAYRDSSTKSDISTILGDKLDSIALLSKHYVAAIGGVKIDDEFKNVTYHVIGSGLLR
jgi:thiamine-phosphate pyrophosphorylase